MRRRRIEKASDSPLIEGTTGVALEKASDEPARSPEAPTAWPSRRQAVSQRRIEEASDTALVESARGVAFEKASDEPIR